MTGAASGIGLATAERCWPRPGRTSRWSIATRRRSWRRPRTLAKERKAPRAHASWPTCATPHAVEGAVAQHGRRVGRARLVVSNAGDGARGARSTRRRARRRCATRSSSTACRTRRVARVAGGVMMAQGRGGCLLFNASKSAFNPGPGFGPYAVAKSGARRADAPVRGRPRPAGHPRPTRSTPTASARALFAGGVAESRAKARGVSRRRLLPREPARARGHGRRRGRRLRLPRHGARDDGLRRHGRRRQRRGVPALSRSRASSGSLDRG